MKLFSALLVTASFSLTLALLFEIAGLMTFFEQAFVLWVLMPIGIGAILAYFMNRTDKRKQRLPRGYMSEQWTAANYK